MLPTSHSDPTGAATVAAAGAAVGRGGKRPRPSSAGSDRTGSAGASAAVPWETGAKDSATHASYAAAAAAAAAAAGAAAGASPGAPRAAAAALGKNKSDAAAAAAAADGADFHVHPHPHPHHQGYEQAAVGTQSTHQAITVNGDGGRQMTRLLRTACLVFDFLRAGGAAEESSIRRALGNTQDVSKGLRRLLSVKLVRRSGRGGRQNPYVYEVSARGMNRRHWASVVPPPPPPNPNQGANNVDSAEASVAALLAARGGSSPFAAAAAAAAAAVPPPVPDPYSRAADPAVARAYASAEAVPGLAGASAAPGSSASAANANANANAKANALSNAAAASSSLRPESAGMRVSAAAAALGPPPGWPPPPPGAAEAAAAASGGNGARTQQQEQYHQHEQGLFPRQQR